MNKKSMIQLSGGLGDEFIIKARVLGFEYAIGDYVNIRLFNSIKQVSAGHYPDSLHLTISFLKKYDDMVSDWAFDVDILKALILAHAFPSGFPVWFDACIILSKWYYRGLSINKPLGAVSMCSHCHNLSFVRCFGCS